MAVIEPTVLDLSAYSIRLIGPKAVVYPDTPGASFTVLNRTDLVARPLPQANLPATADFASGQWTGRINDAGDAKIIWPNKEASDGTPWRYRFDPTNKLMWLEIRVNGFLETVQCITKVTPDRNQVEVDCYDGFQMTKSAYVRDWVCTQAPRDVMERGTQLWVPVVADDFSGNSFAGTWTVTIGGSATASVANGCATFAAPSVTSAQIASASSPVTSSVFQAQCSVSSLTLPPTDISEITFQASEYTGSTYTYSLILATTGKGGYNAIFGLSGVGNIFQVIIAPVPSYGMLIESDGEWVTAYINGQVIGSMRRPTSTPSQLSTGFSLTNGVGGATCYANLASVYVSHLQPFLMRGTDKGDYVLPGTMATYPWGGLHARYFNDLDLQGTSARLSVIMSPPRTQVYSGTSGVPEYANQQDAGINGQQNPLPGAATSNWSVRWFGAIYLKLSGGNYTFTVTGTTGQPIAIRVWIGKTTFGTQLLDNWTFAGTTLPQTFTLTASTLAGNLGFDNGTIIRDGWYPIKVEYAVDATSETAVGFEFTPPVTYTDPGGTTLTSGVAVTVPATSLSPLGCDDQRYQGTSHYDLVQKTGAAFGYQFGVEPHSLESGLFPGVCAPRIREGHDVAVTLEPDNSPRREGIINYSAAVDGTDQASSIQGNGAGFQNGNTGQLQGFVYDPPTLQDALFDMQAWQDNADISYSSLLQAALNAQLGNRLTPWELVSGDPIARDRQVYTWPLPGTLSNMRWRPGDGVLINAPDINVVDTGIASPPRQLLLVTRQIAPNGVTSTQVGFAGRPKSSVYANRTALSAALRPQRNYQPQEVALTGAYAINYSLAATTLDPGYSILALSPGDQVISANLRISVNTGTVRVYVNSVDQTAALSGPFTGQPINISILSICQASSNNSIAAQLYNSGGSAITVEYQLVLTVLR